MTAETPATPDWPRAAQGPPELAADERERLLDAARTVLERSSYESLKMQQLARAAGLSLRAVYRNFEGRADILAALQADELRQGVAWLREVMATGTPPERVRTWVDAMVGLRYRPRGSIRVRLFTLLAPGAVAEATMPSAEFDVALPLIEAIADGKADGVFPNADPEHDGRLISAMCTRLNQSPMRGIPDDRGAATEIVVSFVLRTLTQRDEP